MIRIVLYGFLFGLITRVLASLSYHYTGVVHTPY